MGNACGLLAGSPGPRAPPAATDLSSASGESLGLSEPRGEPFPEPPSQQWAADPRHPPPPQGSVPLSAGAQPQLLAPGGVVYSRPQTAVVQGGGLPPAGFPPIGMVMSPGGMQGAAAGALGQAPVAAGVPVGADDLGRGTGAAANTGLRPAAPERALSFASAEAEHRMQYAEAKVASLEQGVLAVQADWRAGRLQLIDARTQLAQLETQMKAVECKDIDDVQTGDLQSGKALVKGMRKDQLVRLERLFVAVEGLFKELMHPPQH
mmetsp:Transcript_16846/g.58787  ORF Transcript_16846/g.58787 Transcript_16846/m.58787 type:complete len:264 (-) Transcript_16846:76-867(-)|eukprot:CAMPEP_0203865326 /NCGR_PEP_ID=MMETSP0359-20131031/15295_1 /ASSEMBLY_ACC=CAM_ASM_000338 /TAXON_ID=268821 /ORGANISM="Scrippsiella Hangoei, Strain SHTV-5" /LENGTH=263 /DNA_ID=CAMNT_0050783233 /DNA_START=111 /DNA_END=902 /DNA_ORIENTATION=-